MRLADDPEDRCIAGLGFLEQAVGALRGARRRRRPGRAGAHNDWATAGQDRRRAGDRKEPPPGGRVATVAFHVKFFASLSLPQSRFR